MFCSLNLLSNLRNVSEEVVRVFKENANGHRNRQKYTGVVEFVVDFFPFFESFLRSSFSHLRFNFLVITFCAFKEEESKRLTEPPNEMLFLKQRFSKKLTAIKCTINSFTAIKNELKKKTVSGCSVLFLRLVFPNEVNPTIHCTLLL